MDMMLTFGTVRPLPRFSLVANDNTQKVSFSITFESANYTEDLSDTSSELHRNRSNSLTEKVGS